METCEHGEVGLCGLCYAGMRKRVREMESFVADLSEQRKKGEELYTKRLERITTLEAEVARLRMDRHCEHPQTTENRNFLHEGFRLGLEAALSEFGPLWSGDKVTVAEVRKRIRALRPEDIAKEAR